MPERTQSPPTNRTAPAPPPIPPPEPRVLRCANASLYAASAAAVLAACIWYISTHENLSSRIPAALAGLAVLIWAACYCRYRIIVNAEGISSRTLISERRITWQQLTNWRIEHTQDREQATCRIHFTGTDSPRPITITSELSDLDAVCSLARELQGSGGNAPPEPPTPPLNP